MASDSYVRDDYDRNVARDTMRSSKYTELYGSHLLCEVNKDGRYPWRCENCRKFQHPDIDKLQSIYYQFVGMDGPNFCSTWCLNKYRDRNDAYRFGNEETETDRQMARNIANSKRQWKIKTTVKSVESVLNNGTEKQQQNVLDALHAQVTLDETTTTE